MESHLFKNWPNKTGCYLMMNKAGSVIYVGKAKNLKSRVRSYFTASKSLKNNFLSQQIHSMDYILTDTETEALLLEAVLVKKHRPRYNVRLKDDKSYPYIRMSIQDSFPRFYLERKFKKDGSLYFGPYTESYNVRTIIRFLNETYRIRDCSNSFMKSRKTPCITYQMGYCTAPCVGYVEKEKYSLQVQKALDFLKGKNLKAIDDLKKQMKQKANQELFEQALSIKNRIISIEKMWEKQSVWDSKDHKDFDILSGIGNGQSFLFEILHIRSGRLIGHFSHFEKEALWQKSSLELQEQFLAFVTQYYMKNLIPDEIIVSKGFSLSFCKKINSILKRISEKNVRVSHPKGKLEKQWWKMAEKNSSNHLHSFVKEENFTQKALMEIQKRFHLPHYPERIECYDISHFQSQAVYASQVVFENGVKKPQDYRIYKLKDKNDDYLAMKQVLSRRFAHTEMIFPHLILIDGGKGQLQSALRILKEMDLKHLPVLALAKGRSNKDKKFNEKIFLPNRKNAVVLPSQNKAYQILAQLRDEAHRFAISRHRKKLRASLTLSALDSIKGIGEKRKLMLIQKFKTLENIKNMDPVVLSKKSGLNEKLAKRVVSALSQKILN
ncbi:MAG: excinuclease ABC subunit UvrC [Bdellovibrionales bacterium]|nr:excinuclease ABC subunit UvrC [Bdellovibrionales bacterium]